MCQLFTPLRIRDIEFRNRIFMAPMCQYSADDGLPNDWHFVHLGSRAAGGVGLIIAEATAVSPEGRISPGDLGLWNNEQTKAFTRINRFIKSQKCTPGIQLAHAGRKASTAIPWLGGQPLSPAEGGWQTWGPSAVPYKPDGPVPLEMATEHMIKVRDDFVAAAKRALEAGFEVVELHMAHGYLLNEFLSPLSNRRQDQYGGSIENRMRFPLEVTEAVRKAWPQHLPLFVRISASDWVDGGWDLDDSVVLAHELKNIGVDLIDCSSGGNSPHAKIPVEPGYQVPFAAKIRKDSKILTGAVGLITDPHQAESILTNGHADAVLLARELLRNPHWALHAAHELDQHIQWPVQYERAIPR